jgi:hypothetical protein
MDDAGEREGMVFSLAAGGLVRGGIAAPWQAAKL